MQLVALGQLAAMCWAEEAAGRPAAPEVCARLQELLNAVGGRPAPADGIFCVVGAPNGPSATAPAGTTAPGNAIATGADSAAGKRALHEVEPYGEAPKSGANDDGRASIAPVELLREAAKALGVHDAPMLRVGWEASAGRRGADRMEDRTVALTAGGVALAAVFDGHNGDAAADYCQKQLLRLLHARLMTAAAPDGEGEAKATKAADALRHTFVHLHDAFTSSLGADASGCTALAALCVPGSLLVANAGDCRCVLWRTDEASGGTLPSHLHQRSRAARRDSSPIRRSSSRAQHSSLPTVTPYAKRPDWPPPHADTLALPRQ